MQPDHDPYASNAPGCALNRGIIAAIGAAFLWMLFVVPAYQRWRYGDPPTKEQQQQSQDVKPGVKPNDAVETDGGAATPEEIAERLAQELGAPGIASAMGVENSIPGEAQAGAEAIATDATLQEKRFTIETDELVIEFTTRDASIRTAALKQYHFTSDATEPMEVLHPLRGTDGSANSYILRSVIDDEVKESPFGDIENLVWELVHSVEDDGVFPKRIAFRLVTGGFELKKTFLVKQAGTMFGIEVEITNRTSKRINLLKIDLVGPNGLVNDETMRSSSRTKVEISATLAGYEGEDFETHAVGHSVAMDAESDDRYIAYKSWAALRNRYFAAVMQIQDPETIEKLLAEGIVPEKLKDDDRLGQKNIAVVARLKADELDSGQTMRSRFYTYFGPLHEEVLAQAVWQSDSDSDSDDAEVAKSGLELGWGALINQGFFATLSGILLWFLRLFYSIVGNYGVAILLLTITFKAALHPLQRKAIVGMQKMQKLAPEMKVIRKRYENDKSAEAQRKMQLEIMELHKKHGVSPLGGCLPMLVQMPMFIAFYGMLQNAFELRQAGFLWISDLAQPDVLFALGFQVPYLGWDKLHLLPIIYAGLFMLQQKLQPKSDDPQAQQMQKTMKFMVVFFFFLFYQMPSGLVLYFVFSNGFGIVENWYIRKYLVPDAGPVGPQAGTNVFDNTPAPPTSWDKQEARDVRAAEKRKKRDEGNQPRLK